MPFRFARGVFLILSFTLALLPLFVLMSPVYLTVFIHSVRFIRLRRVYTDILSGVYLDFAAAMLASPVTGTKVHLYSNEPTDFFQDRGVLLLSNHRCRVDWMFSGFVWCNAILSNGALRFILKDSIRGVPIFGWVMTAFMYIFLTRKNREQDVEHIHKMVRYLISSGDRPTLMIFPEGTDLTDESVAKSQEYSEKHGFPKLKYVLCPKISGVETVLNRLRGHGAAVHDLTVAYKDYRMGEEGDTRPSETGMWSGEFPEEVHITIKRFDADELPVARSVLERWVLGSFVQKEKLLKGFYENGSVIPTIESVNAAASRLKIKSSTNEEADQLLASSEPWPTEIPIPIRIFKPLLIMFLWVFGLLLALIYLSWMRWYFLMITIYCLIIRMLFKGFDLVELQLHGSIIDRMEAEYVHVGEPQAEGEENIVSSAASKKAN